LTTPPRRTTPATRATRRSRRPGAQSQTFLERNRPRLLWGAAGLVFVLLLGMAYLGFTKPTYACTTIFDPSPAPSWVAPSAAPVASGATPAPAVTPPPPGYVQTDMGHVHENVGTTITYRYCPPASGRHYNSANQGPIRGGLYGPNDQALPPGWIHNLEHGAIVLLYSCKAPEGQTAPACTDAGQQQLEDLLARWPDSPICKTPKGLLTPLIARFDDMPWNYSALVWDVVLPMDEIDEALMFEFYARNAELYNPEKLCADPTATPGPATPTPVPTASPAASAAASVAASPATSAAPASTGSAAPATTAP
jgi:hypothetical protein